MSREVWVMERDGRPWTAGTQRSHCEQVKLLAGREGDVVVRYVPESELTELRAQLQEALRRQWSIRVLDAWEDNAPTIRTCQIARRVAGGFTATLHDDFNEGRRFWCVARDGARLAAAIAVFADLPAEVRTELGERP